MTCAFRRQSPGYPVAQYRYKTLLSVFAFITLSLFRSHLTHPFSCPSCPLPLKGPSSLQSVPSSTQSVAGLSYQGRNVSICEQAGDPEESVPNTPSPSREYVRGIEYVPGAGRSHGGTNGSAGTTVE